MSVLMNELFRSSEFISFGVQKLAKVHVNSKQCCFGFVPQPKQYITGKPARLYPWTHLDECHCSQ